MSCVRDRYVPYVVALGLLWSAMNGRLPISRNPEEQVPPLPWFKAGCAWGLGQALATAFVAYFAWLALDILMKIGLTP